MVKPAKYVRKPLHVDVLGPITEENMNEIASLIKGTVRTEGDKKFIKVKVHQPKNERHTKAYVTDRILVSPQGLKVYNEKAFLANFEPVDASS